MRLVISTDGIAKREYAASSTSPDMECADVTDIRYGRTCGGADDHAYAYVELAPDQALGIVIRLLRQLVDEDVLQGWSVKYR